jgi:hypothetical protein
MHLLLFLCNTEAEREVKKQNRWIGGNGSTVWSVEAFKYEVHLKYI